MEQFEVHDPAILAHARGILDNAGGHDGMAREVVAAVERNEAWRGKNCINLLAPEAPTSPDGTASPRVRNRHARRRKATLAGSTAGLQVRNILTKSNRSV